MSPRRIALIVGAVASLLTPLTLFLTYVKIGGVTATGWETFSRADVLVVLGGLAGAAALAAAAFTGQRVLAPLGVAITAMTFGALLFNGIELVHQLGRQVGAFGLGLSPGRVLGADIGVGGVLGIVVSAIATLAALASTMLADEAPARSADVYGTPQRERGASTPSAEPYATRVDRPSPSPQPAPGAAAQHEPAREPARTEVRPGGTADRPAGAEARPGTPAEQPAQAEERPRAAPAGWYDDPTGAARKRYWDGSRWTEHTDG
jgi:hypothetical protein